MGVKIEVMTAAEAAKKYKGSYPANKLLNLVKRIDRLLEIVDSPAAIRIHSIKRSAPITKGRKVEVEYFVDKEMAEIARQL